MCSFHLQKPRTLTVHSFESWSVITIQESGIQNLAWQPCKSGAGEILPKRRAMKGGWKESHKSNSLKSWFPLCLIKCKNTLLLLFPLFSILCSTDERFIGCPAPTWGNCDLQWFVFTKGGPSKLDGCRKHHSTASPSSWGPTWMHDKPGMYGRWYIWMWLTGAFNKIMS